MKNAVKNAVKYTVKKNGWVKRIKRRIVRCSVCGWISPREDVTYCDECDAWLCDLCLLDHNCDEGLTVLLEEALRREAGSGGKAGA